ncbi:MAG TPA: MauE/DoxX family redox-associated membrane protein [Chitinophagaceae bacterium]|jgi:hypothetical protein
MKNSHYRWLFCQVTSFLLIVLFAYTAISKLAGHLQFEKAIGQSPVAFLNPQTLSWTIPLVELAAVILLVIPSANKAGTILSLTLMAIFSLYVGYMLLFVPRLPCNCGGIIETLSWHRHLFVNIFFTTIAALSLLARRSGERGTQYSNTRRLWEARSQGQTQKSRTVIPAGRQRRSN